METGAPYFPSQAMGPMPMMNNFLRMPTPVQVPPGLQALYSCCHALYPNQTNPLQVTAVKKFWLGGPDPLDYVNMYSNPGDPAKGIPSHWHYVSFGLSDLFGDGRVHDFPTGPGNPSGFGFELTFRLKREAEDVSAPTWPAAMMQSLAKYVFQSENSLCPGDHVSWNCSLDNSDSRIQHMLLTEDPQLGNVGTPFGSVTFVQIVGVCQDELRAAQQWNGPGLIDLMKSVPVAGGPWLITDMRRGESIFEVDPELRDAVEDGIAAEGSNLSGASARCTFSEKSPSEIAELSNLEAENKSPILSTGNEDMEGNRSTLSPTLNKNLSRASRHSSMSVTQDDAASRMSCHEPAAVDQQPIELLQTKFLNSVHISINQEAGNILPLALRGRLKHGRHFTFKTVTGTLAITFLTESVTGSYATLEQPYAKHGPWLQVLIPNDFVDEVLNDLKELNNLESSDLPKTYEWPSKKLSITIQPENVSNNSQG